MIVQDIAVIDYAEPVKSVKLTFLEVYPGTEFEDLCIRRIRLESPLDEEPEVKFTERPS